jgi:hypothetical protein
VRESKANIEIIMKLQLSGGWGIKRIPSGKLEWIYDVIVKIRLTLVLDLASLLTDSLT